MSNIDKSKLTGYTNEAEIEHDEFHSSLEVDDTSGWRVFIVPGLAILFLIGAIALFFLSTSDTTPDPRVQAQIRAKQQQQQSTTPPPADVTGQPMPDQPAAPTEPAQPPAQ